MDSLFAWHRIALFFACCVAAAPARTEPVDPAPPPIEAVWKVQRLEFNYLNGDTIYTCASLRQKLARILEALGAHEHMRLQSGMCDETGRSRIVVVLASPVIATEENVRALTTYSAEQLLIARTRGMRLPAAEDLQRFPAHWKTVSFARDRSMRLSPGDCDLVRQLRRQVLPHLSVQITQDSLNCGSALFNPRLTVAALTADERNE